MKLPASRSTASSNSSGTSNQPARQPVIEKYFENELTTIELRLNRHALIAGSV
ncbi:MAG TPA: hypothetical protein VIM17_00545 [Jatrophihabitantaceae bacterium]